jgi:ABC-type amino acid transport substrate-binding protein
MLGALALATGSCFAIEELPADAFAGTIEELRASKTLRLAYDADAPPFSYIVPGSPPNAEPQGYSLELCRAIAAKLREQLKIGRSPRRARSWRPCIRRPACRTDRQILLHALPARERLPCASRRVSLAHAHERARRSRSGRA